MVKKEETNAERFERLASKRATKVLQSIDVLGNCAGTGYEFTEEQVVEMFDALARALEACNEKFSPKTRDQKRRSEFAFSPAGEIGA